MKIHRCNLLNEKQEEKMTMNEEKEKNNVNRNEVDQRREMERKIEEL